MAYNFFSKGSSDEFLFANGRGKMRKYTQSFLEEEIR